MSAILFGSISTVADTSELQRAAFNEAFHAHGLNWTWDRAEYIEMLRGSGGQNRIADYAAGHGASVDAAAVHQTKSEIFQNGLATARLEPRAGVLATIEHAKSAGKKLALVTTTSPENIDALTKALAGTLSFSDFDLIVDSSLVQQPKPDQAAYTFALDELGESAADCVAIEDNEGGVHAAVAAGLRCIAFPNENTAGHDFEQADSVVDRLNLS